MSCWNRYDCKTTNEIHFMSVNYTRDYKAIRGSADRTKYDHWCDAVMGPQLCFTQLHFIISVVLTLCKPNRLKKIDLQYKNSFSGTQEVF